RLWQEHSDVSQKGRQRQSKIADVLGTTVVDQRLAIPEIPSPSILLVFFFDRIANTALSVFESFTKQLLAALVRIDLDCPTDICSSLNNDFGEDIRRPDILQIVNDLVIPLCLLFRVRTVLLDGIDTCKPTESDLVWSWMKRVRVMVTAIVLVSSQEQSNVCSNLSFDEGSRIQVDRQSNSGDFDTHIDEQIAQRAGPGYVLYDKKLYDWVPVGPSSAAIHFARLCYARAMKEAVRGLPDGLEELYARLSASTCAKRPLCNGGVLVWICAARAPLSVGAVRELWAMNMDIGEVWEDAMPGLNPLLESGVGLLQLDATLHILLPVHHTVYDFVFSEKERNHFQSLFTQPDPRRPWLLSFESSV
ncbi:hypothetical protein LTR95_001546, partial [Oleoguttula sp. CCFEE 5521]